MSEERLARLLRALHFLATRVPRIVLHRAEDIFPSLQISMVSVLWSCSWQIAVSILYHILDSSSCHGSILHTKSVSTGNLSQFCPRVDHALSQLLVWNWHPNLLEGLRHSENICWMETSYFKKIADSVHICSFSSCTDCELFMWTLLV
jgi:hypothetical protein